MRSIIWVTLCSAISVAALSPEAQAGEAPGVQPGATAGGAVLEELVVTAQKRDQRLQDVGIAIQAYNGNQLATLGVKESGDLVKLIPGLNLAGSYGGQKLVFSVRGVTEFDFSDHIEAPNAVYIDEGYVASQQGQAFGLFDVDRVEVLKGPQGTLFGRNATGGAISMFSRAPTRTEDGYLETQFGSYGERRIEGAVGGPVTDKLSVRFAGFYAANDADFHNLHPGQASEGNQEVADGRLRLHYDATDTVKLDLIAFAGKTTMSTSPYLEVATISQFNAAGNIANSFNVSPTEVRQAIGPGGANIVVDTFTPALRPTPGGDFHGWVPDPNSLDYQKAKTSSDFNKLSSNGVTAKVTADLNGVTVTDIVDYKHNDSRLGLTFDASVVSDFNSETIANLDQYSEELRANGQSGPVQWIAGLYFLRIEEATPVAGFTYVPIATEFRDSVSQTSDSFAGFTQEEYKFANDFKLIAGFRVSKEDKKYHYETNLYDRTDTWTDPSSGHLIAPFRKFDGKLSEVLYAGKLQLEWQPSRDLLVYAGYNRGVKGGGFSAPLGGSAFAFVPDSALKYRPEQLNDYEGGVKSTFLNGRVRLNGAVYYYDYVDYQALKVIGITNSTINANATTKGAEFEFATVSPTGLSLSVNGSYVDMVVHDVDINGTVADRRNANTPKYQTSVILGYDRDAWGGVVSFKLSGKYSSSMFYSLSNYDSTLVPGYFSGDLRVAYKVRNWEASLAVQNFTDSHRPTIGYDLSALCGCSLVAYGKPRWVTAGLKYSF